MDTVSGCVCACVLSKKEQKQQDRERHRERRREVIEESQQQPTHNTVFSYDIISHVYDITFQETVRCLVRLSLALLFCLSVSRAPTQSLDFALLLVFLQTPAACWVVPCRGVLSMQCMCHLLCVCVRVVLVATAICSFFFFLLFLLFTSSQFLADVDHVTPAQHVKNGAPSGRARDLTFEMSGKSPPV